MLRTKCPQCRKKLDPGQRIHDECVDAFAKSVKAKAEWAALKKVNQQDKERKEKLKSRAKWLAECQAIINKYVRLRDRNLPCCSCERPASWDGQWHASHYRSVGAASAVRFNLWNIHKGCSICNNHLSGNIANYRPRIIERIGIDRFEWLESQNQLVRYDIEYLKRLKEVMGRRLKRMELKHGQ